MLRRPSLILTAALLIGGFLATPGTSRADFPFGVHIDIGRTHFEFGRNVGHGHHRLPVVHHQHYRPVTPYGYAYGSQFAAPSSFGPTFYPGFQNCQPPVMVGPHRNRHDHHHLHGWRH